MRELLLSIPLMYGAGHFIYAPYTKLLLTKYCADYMYYLTDYMNYLTEPLVVEEGSVLTAEVTQSEALVASAVLDLDVRFTDLDFSQCNRVGTSWLPVGGREREG